jgi:hypothetical protein
MQLTNPLCWPGCTPLEGGAVVVHNFVFHKKKVFASMILHVLSHSQRINQHGV